MHPAAGLVSRVNESTARILMNRDPVGRDLGLRYSEPGVESTERDVWMDKSADENVIELARDLGLLTELFAFQHLMCDSSSMRLDQIRTDTDPISRAL